MLGNEKEKEDNIYIYMWLPFHWSKISMAIWPHALHFFFEKQIQLQVIYILGNVLIM